MIDLQYSVYSPTCTQYPMSLFQTLLEKLQSRLIFGNNKHTNFASSQITALLRGDQIDPELFWRTLDGEQGKDGKEGQSGEQIVSYYCMQLYRSLCSKSHPVHLEQKMLSTLLVLDFYRNSRHKGTQWQNEMEKVGETSHHKWILQYFLRSAYHQDYASLYLDKFTFKPRAANWNRPLAQQLVQEIRCCQPDPKRHKQLSEINHPEMLRLKRLSFPQPLELQSRSLTFAYECFLDSIRANGCTVPREVYQQMKELLVLHIQAVTDNSDLLCYLAVVISTIGNCVRFFGCAEDDLMKEMIILAHQIRSMPYWVGFMGQQLSTLLLRELKMKGAAFRDQLMLDYDGFSSGSMQGAQRQFYFVSRGDDFLERNQQISYFLLRRRVIQHLVRVSCIADKQIEHFITVLDQLSQKQISVLFEKALKITEVACSLEGYQKIRTVQRESMAQLIKQTMQRYLQRRRSGTSEHDPKPTLTELFVSELRPRRDNNPESLKIIDSHPCHLFWYPPSYRVTHVQLSQFLDPKSTLSFASLLHRHRSKYAGSGYLCSRVKLGLIFHGRRQQFPRFIGPLCEYFHCTPVAQLAGIRIYYLPRASPIPQMSIANYIGCHDVLYRRTVYNCFRERVLYPYIEPNARNRGTLPALMMNRNLQTYLRQARSALSLHVQKCVIRKEGIERRYIEEVVYWTESLQLGMFVDAELIRNEKSAEQGREAKQGKEDKYYSKQLVDVIANKMKKLNTLSISLEMECWERLGNVSSSHKQQFLKTSDLHLCNTPHEYFLGRRPHPASPLLQMTILTAHNGRLFQKQLHNPHVYKCKDAHEMVMAFKDLLIEHTVRKCRIENLDKDRPLRVMIDGVLHEGVDSLEVGALLGADGRGVVLGLATWVPVP